MPRILRILNRLAIGGPVLNATYLTRYLAPEYETLLVVGEREGHEQSASHITDSLGISYHTLAGMGRALNPAGDYEAYRQLKKLIRDFKPDIVHTHAAKPGALGRLAAAQMKVPAIVHTFHGHVFHSYFNSWKTKAFIQVERYLARKSDAIVVISEQQRRELAEDFQIAPPSKFRVVPLGFDLGRFVEGQAEKRQSFRSEFGLREDEVAIGIVGRLVPIKNHPLFLYALRQVLDRTSKRVKAFIVGDGESRPGLEALARELGIGYTTEKDAVHDQPLIFTSWRQDIDRICAGVDIICLTSFNEGTPVSLIEAQAANRPIVSTRVGGIADIVQEGATALLAGVDQKEQFSEHLVSLVENDVLRRSMGNQSREFVLQRFSYQRLVTDMDQLYRTILKGKGLA
jgi:glycosyltransferase involved in cell wall biosynthesis